ncbi:MAG: ATP-binding protein [Pseudomonadota bacterium]
MPAIGACRPRDGIASADIRAARRLCPTLMEQITSRPSDVRDVLASLCTTLQALRLDAADCATLEIVLAEVLNNIVEHAYLDEHDGWILLELDYLDGWIACKLTDGGCPMPEGQLPTHRALGDGVDVALLSLPEGGFGWSMIYELTCDLRYQRIGALNALYFALPLTAQG